MIHFLKFFEKSFYENIIKNFTILYRWMISLVLIVEALKISWISIIFLKQKMPKIYDYTLDEKKFLKILNLRDIHFILSPQENYLRKKIPIYF